MFNVLNQVHAIYEYGVRSRKLFTTVIEDSRYYTKDTFFRPWLIFVCIFQTLNGRTYEREWFKKYFCFGYF